jgi:hypothetical protein
MPFDAVVADLNGDGDEDAAVIVKYSGLYIYRNTGSSLNPSPVRLQFLPHGTAIDTGDFNGDSVPDLAYILENTIQILVNDATGEHFNAERFLNGPLFSFALKTPDLNRDGISDIVAVGAMDTHIYLYLSTAPMTFDLMKIDMAGKPLYFDFSAKTLSVADVDGDGFVDILIPEFRNSALWLIQNKEGKTFTPRLIASGAPLDLIQYAVFLNYDSVRKSSLIAFVSGTEKPMITTASLSGTGALAIIDVKPLPYAFPVHITKTARKSGEISLVITHSCGLESLKGALTKAVIDTGSGHILALDITQTLPSSGVMSAYVPGLKSLLTVCQTPDGIYITAGKD